MKVKLLTLPKNTPVLSVYDNIYLANGKLIIQSYNIHIGSTIEHYTDLT